MGTGESISVILPSFREGARLIEAVRAARCALGDVQVIVSAHDESDDVKQAVRAEGAIWVDAPRACRGEQLQRGAACAEGQVLVFLHADTRLPVDASRPIRQALSVAGVSGGAFRLRFDRSHVVFSTLTAMSGLRLTTSFLGDQGMFCTRRAYDAAGGFRSMPLFEDVDLARRLARTGRLVRLEQYVVTSARRFSKHGPLRQVTRNAVLMLAYHLGVAPAQLARAYEAPELPDASPDRKSHRSGPRRIARTHSRIRRRAGRRA